MEIRAPPVYVPMYVLCKPLLAPPPGSSLLLSGNLGIKRERVPTLMGP